MAHPASRPARTDPAPPGPGVDFILLWHMHQPDYREQAGGEFRLPWVYLHALKDYSDMAWHLERNPAMRAVVNFVPVLLDQIEDYCDQFATGTLRDPLLRLLARSDDTPLSRAEHAHALEQCFRANHEHLIAPFPAYNRLHEIFHCLDEEGADATRYLSDQYIYELVTWYHLAWTGEGLRRDSQLVAQLMAKGTQFTPEDRAALLQVVAETIRDIVPRYRRLEERGQIEISTTPHGHPLAPLMIDFQCAKEALPDITLPHAERYPGGRGRVNAHIELAREDHQRRFGRAPTGMWPAEGALSTPFAALIAAHGFQWAASSEAVLRNSLRASGVPDSALVTPHYRPYHLGPLADPGAPKTAGRANSLTLFFRDDRLSDLIGFEYARWHGRDASEHFVREVAAIADRDANGAASQGNVGTRPCVCVMLDGENAWEYYPYNGFYFLSGIYAGLATHPRIRLLTCSEAAAERHRTDAPPGAIGALRALAAGSWVYGNLSTWIGARDKNTAWDLLCEAKVCFDRVMASKRLDAAQRRQATAQLSDCESSDWFWWLGDNNPAPSVASFEAMFRAKLARLYELLRLPVPEQLSIPFHHGDGSAEHGGTMKRVT